MSRAAFIHARSVWPCAGVGWMRIFCTRTCGCVPSHAVVSTREDVDDGHEILGEFLFCGAYVVILDHECRVVLSTNPFKELECEAAESVLVGNHNLFDTSLHDVFHHP